MIRKTFNQRFWEKVDKTGACWNWTACITQAGYGQIKVLEKLEYAHRMSWRMHNGQIPKGVCVLHKCDNPKCLNPNHLFLGSKIDNANDKVSKGRQAKGQQHGMSKLTESDVLKIIELKRYGFSTIEIAGVFLIDKSRVNKICKKTAWKHI